MLNGPFSPWPSFTEEEAEAVSRVLLSNKVNYWTGQEGREFEREFAAFAGTDYAVAVGNGTLALDLALKGLGIGAGDEVLLAWIGVRYVVDYDDAIFHNYDLSSNAWVRRFLGRKIDTVMRHAACVIAGNDYLADRAKAAGAKRIVVIPTVVDLRRYSAGNGAGATITIGWIGSPTTQKYVEQLLPALKALSQAHAFRLMLVGATEDTATRLPGIEVIVCPWSEDTEAALIREMDIGIMPLEDGPWEKGKCGYKLIQYMASSVPVVASPVGVNPDIVNGAGCGLLAANDSEWAIALLKLLNSGEIRDKFGASGRVAVENQYSIDSQLRRLESCLLVQERQ
ncbi:glycosyltransferase [Alcanivorax sp.]|jgi:glycosyltransferase involved in cell wall biosynthesis|uniref:glycosyltransferase family 4 protein n=1 Tax=Alcanivorax sp. TaxID=1872427 RepID=UPI0032D92865